MFKSSPLYLAIAAALALPSAASANFLEDIEISGFLKISRALYLGESKDKTSDDNHQR